MKRFSMLLASALLLGASGAQAQSLNGHRVGVQFLFPDQNSVFEDDGANRVGTDQPTSVFFGFVSVSFTDSTVTATFNTRATWQPYAFNGLRLYDIDGAIDPFSVGGVTGIDAARVTSDANDLYVNWQGLTFGTGDRLTVTLRQPLSLSVPEPATWAAMTLGFGLVGAALRRRTATRAALA